MKNTQKRLKVREMDPLNRSILYRQRAIDRMKENIRKIRQRADNDVSAVEQRIREKSVLLDALKRGSLKA